MSRIVHVRNVPDDVYEHLETRAVSMGVSVSELVLRQLSGQTPAQGQLGLRDWLALVADDEPVELPPGAVVAALHAGRAERD